MEGDGEKGSWKDTNEPDGFKVGAATWKMLACVATEKKSCVFRPAERDLHTSCFCCAFESAILFQAGGCCRLWQWMAAGSTAHLGGRWEVDKSRESRLAPPTNVRASRLVSLSLSLSSLLSGALNAA